MRPDSSDPSALPSPSGDSALRRSFNRLYDENIERIETMAFLKLGNIHDAQNAAADVFVAAWRRIASGDSAVDVPWLYATLHNVVGNEYRRRERSARLDARATAVFASSTASVRSDDDRDLIAAITKLESSDREVIWLVYFEQLSNGEVARILGCTAAAARKRAERARTRLATMLAVAADRGEEGVL